MADAIPAPDANNAWRTRTPGHENWPHSAAAIEHTRGGLDDSERAKILGLNATRIFKLPVPARYLQQADVAAATGDAR